MNNDLVEDSADNDKEEDGDNPPTLGRNQKSLGEPLDYIGYYDI